MLGYEHSLAHEPWPEHDPKLLLEDTVEYPIQIRGKVRSRITVPADATQDQVSEAALADEKVLASLGDQKVRKVIVVPGKMVNIVVG